MNAQPIDHTPDVKMDIEETIWSLSKEEVEQSLWNKDHKVLGAMKNDIGLWTLAASEPFHVSYE